VLRVFAGAAVLAFALLLTGCGGDKSPRARVSAYFRQVNQIEHDLGPQMNKANIAFRRFSAQLVDAKEVTELKTAEGTIRVLHDRLAKVKPPKQAEQIHRDLLQLVSLQADFADGVVELAAYGPRLNAVLTRVAASGARLKKALKSRSALKQAAAFKTYASALRGDVTQVDALKAPAVAVPSQHAESARLARTAVISQKIAVALKPIKPPARLSKKEARNKQAVLRYNREALSFQKLVLKRRQALNRLLGQLGSLSSLADRRRVRAEQVKAVKAFDKRLYAIGRLAARIQHERLQLERNL
jgi:hypothetical protein